VWQFVGLARCDPRGSWLVAAHPAPRLLCLVQHFGNTFKTKMLKKKCYRKIFFNILENVERKNVNPTFSENVGSKNVDPIFTEKFWSNNS
jgi:hypothetical protein